MHDARIDLKPLAFAAATNLLNEVEGAGCVLVATADGFNLAHAGPRNIDPARLAAVVSSIAALGDAASRETGIGTPRCLVVESSDGRLVVRCMQVRGESIVVVLLTDASVLLGLVWKRLADVEHWMNR
jgi:uncharacterized protein